MNRLKICLVHNEYIHAGGEDAVFRAERALLTDAGHEVFEYREQNQRIANGNPMAIAFGTIWSERSRRKLGQLLRDTGSDVCHFHNTFPLISPSAYYACKRAGVATIQTLHNFRFVCPAATMFRDGAVCEDCVGHAVPWPAVAHACYRDSRVASAAVAGMLTVHRGLRTFDREVDFYIAPTDFTRRKLAAGGLPADKIVVKPHFLWDDPGIGRHQGGYALFVGRLTPEKGVPTLLRAWDQLKNVLPLKILGVGPLESAVRSASAEWAGQQPRECVFAMMRDATFLIFASEWYEVFGLTILEAFATGMPVICSRLGAPAEIVEDNKTGLLFTPGDAADLVRKVSWAVQHPDIMAQMGRNARIVFEDKYTRERNLRMLLDIYERAARTSAPHRHNVSA